MAISLSAITLINRVPENCRLPKIVPQTDKKAYKKYPKYAQWYDRYLVMKDQGTMVGLFNEDPVEKYYPIFVKPRINLEGFNKDCHLFETPEDFNKFRDGLSEKKKTELFWSVFLPGPEGSTDLILHNGDIKMGFHMTATSSTDKHEYLEYGRDIEFIPEYNLNKIPKWILDWTNNHLQGFTGIVNIQYRRDKIIEVSYRPDGGGRFWMILEWPELMQTLDKLYKENKWIEPENEPEVRKYYVRKPIIPKPLILTPMLFVLDILVRSLGIKYWYPYTEPGYKETNLAGIIDKDKKKAENVANIIVIFYFIYVFIYFGLVLYWLTYGRKIINERLKLQEYFWYIGIVLLLSIPYLPKFFPRFVLF